MLYMAGMLNTFMDIGGNAKDCFTILTTSANASMSPFHDRMPSILSEHECEKWINNETFMQEVLMRVCPELVWKIAV